MHNVVVYEVTNGHPVTLGVMICELKGVFCWFFPRSLHHSVKAYWYYSGFFYSSNFFCKPKEFFFATYQNAFIHVAQLSENDEGIRPCVLKTSFVLLLLTPARLRLLSLILGSRDTCKVETFADDVGLFGSRRSQKDKRFRSLPLG